jgi:hypothetical protein
MTGLHPQTITSTRLTPSSLGLARIKIVSRIVNLFESSPTAKPPTSARGSLYLVVKDNTDTVTYDINALMLEPARITIVGRSRAHRRHS